MEKQCMGQLQESLPGLYTNHGMCFSKQRQSDARR